MKGKIFDTEMVNEILKCEKTQFREPIKPQPSFIECNVSKVYKLENMKQVKIEPPYKIGDIMFIKETWKLTNPNGDFERNNRTAEYMYKTRHSKGKRIAITQEMEKNLGAWKPALCMTQEAAKVFIKIKNIKVQRLQDITENEIKNEGISYDEEIYKMPCSVENAGENYLKGCFMRTWNRRNQKNSHGWDCNPWIWSIEFEKVD